jgi:hypothetical protein
MKRSWLLFALAAACGGNLCYDVSGSDWRFDQRGGIISGSTTSGNGKMSCSPLGAMTATDDNVEIVADVPLGAEVGERVVASIDNVQVSLLGSAWQQLSGTMTILNNDRDERFIAVELAIDDGNGTTLAARLSCQPRPCELFEQEESTEPPATSEDDLFDD